MSRWTEKRLVETVENNISIAGVLRDLGLQISGGNYRQFNKYKRLYNLNTDHFKGQGHLRGVSHSWSKRIPLDEILVENSTYTNGTNLRKRLLEAELLEYECAWCNRSEWRGQELVLHIDHINGINNDNRIENLRFLCPNCHSQTDTYGSKNIKIGRTKHTCDDCGSPCSAGAKRCIDCHHKQLAVASSSEPNSCKDCGTPISRKATRCKSCAGKARDTKVDWPSCAVLVERVRSRNYSAVARDLGVSDNAVRKRLRTYYEGDLP